MLTLCHKVTYYKKRNKCRKSIIFINNFTKSTEYKVFLGFFWQDICVTHGFVLMAYSWRCLDNHINVGTEILVGYIAQYSEYEKYKCKRMFTYMLLIAVIDHFI